MKKLFTLLVPVVLLVWAETGLQAQNTARNESFCVRLDGGLSWAFNSAFDHQDGVRAHLTQPSVGLGIMWYHNSRTRIGLQYDYSRIVREQAGTLVQLPGGGVEGDVYKDFKAQLHALSLMGEYKLLGNDRLSAYAGAGLGFLLGAGNNYSLGIKNEMLSGGAGNIVHVNGHNEQVLDIFPAVPLTFSLEYVFLPQVAVNVAAGYRFVLAGHDAFVPKGQLSATVGLVFHFQ